MNQLPVTDEPVEFEKSYPLEVQNFKKNTDLFKIIYGKYPNLIWKKPQKINM